MLWNLCCSTAACLLTRNRETSAQPLLQGSSLFTLPYEVMLTDELQSKSSPSTRSPSPAAGGRGEACPLGYAGAAGTAAGARPDQAPRPARRACGTPSCAQRRAAARRERAHPPHAAAAWRQTQVGRPALREPQHAGGCGCWCWAGGVAAHWALV